MRARACVCVCVCVCVLYFYVIKLEDFITVLFIHQRILRICQRNASRILTAYTNHLFAGHAKTLLGLKTDLMSYPACIRGFR